MADRPDSFMPMFIGDYMADTMHLTTLEHGAYLLLIFHYWRSGVALMDDDALLIRITRLSAQEWKRSRSTIKAFFKPAILDGDNVLTHPRVERELVKAGIKYQARKEASDAANAAKRAKADALRAANRDGDRDGIPNGVPLGDRDGDRLGSQPQPQPQPQSKPDGLESRSQRARAQSLLSRICEILRIRLLDDPERVTWQRQIEEALHDGLTETELIKATETARTNGKISFPYIRAVAMKPTKTTEEKPNGSGREKPQKRSTTDSHLAGIALLRDELARGRKSGADEGEGVER